MTEIGTAFGEGIDVDLILVEDNDGRRRSLIGLQWIGSDVTVGLNNIEALTLVQEIVALVSVNEDTAFESAEPEATMTNAEALELHFLTRAEERDE